MACVDATGSTAEGFLLVPALMLATGMPITNVVGSSLVCVMAFGLTTAASYAALVFVDWTMAAGRLSRLLATRKNVLTRTLAVGVIAVGALIAARGWHAVT